MVPLPCVQTLRNWSANFDVQPGILKDVLKVMHIKERDLPAIQKLTVLSFDEIYISNKVDLERRQQKIYGPKKNKPIQNGAKPVRKMETDILLLRQAYDKRNFVGSDKSF